MTDVRYLTLEELEAGLDEIRRSPKDGGVLELIVRRPQTGEREILEEAELNLVEGLVGDSWQARGSSRSGDRSPNLGMQLTMMNTRAIALVAQAKERWPLAGDQLYIDLDLSVDNLPPGTQLALGSAVIEVTGLPHTGCKRFAERFGTEAVKLFNSALGKQLQLRGINAKVVRPGVIRIGDRAQKF